MSQQTSLQSVILFPDGFPNHRIRKFVAAAGYKRAAEVIVHRQDLTTAEKNVAVVMSGELMIKALDLLDASRAEYRDELRGRVARAAIDGVVHAMEAYRNE